MSASISGRLLNAFVCRKEDSADLNFVQKQKSRVVCLNRAGTTGKVVGSLVLIGLVTFGVLGLLQSSGHLNLSFLSGIDQSVFVATLGAGAGIVAGIFVKSIHAQCQQTLRLLNRQHVQDCSTLFAHY